MDFPTHVVPSYDYHPYYSPLQQHEGLFDDPQTSKSHPVNRLSVNGSPIQLAMDRFLQERDRPSTWFTTRMNAPPPPFPTLDYEHAYHDHFAHPAYRYRYPSPTDSGQSSAYNSSGHSDHQSSPWSSPNLNAAPRSPESLYLDHPESGFGLRYSHEQFKGGISAPCVTLHDVQCYPDAQPEAVRFEDESNYFAVPQEGFEPMQQESVREETVHNGLNGVVDGNGHDSIKREASSPESPNIRRRRPTGTRSTSSSAKVTKRPTSFRRSSSFSKTNGHKTHSHCQSNSNRAFPCPFAIYSCPATFGAKNEWKRHVNTQHMQTGYWRCDQCDQSERKPNDFNRKDLFIQHVRRMHPLEAEKPSKTKAHSSRPAKNDSDDRELNAIANRCFMSIREPPEECACIVCDVKFTGAGAWDERLEHIGKHWEATKRENDEPNNAKDWREDHALHKFLGHQGIIAADGKRWVLA